MARDVKVTRGKAYRAGGELSSVREGFGEPVDEKPRSVYEVVTRQMLGELKEDVAEIKGRVNALLWLMAGAVVAEFVLRIVR